MTNATAVTTGVPTSGAYPATCSSENVRDSWKNAMTRPWADSLSEAPGTCHSDFCGEQAPHQRRLATRKNESGKSEQWSRELRMQEMREHWGRGSPLVQEIVSDDADRMAMAVEALVRR